MMNPAADDDRLPTAIPILRDRWFQPLRAPWRRRGLALAWLASTLAMFALIVVGGRSIDIGIPALILGSVLNVTMRNMSDAGADLLDERMVAVRNHAFRTAYYAVGVAIVAAVGGAVIGGYDTVTLDRNQLLGVAWASAMVTMFLPAAILAWTEEVV